MKESCPAVMLQGTGSDVGKSLILAGLARAYSRRGLAVRPFKPQNMSNNAAVTLDGGEIGRAQALQARACGLAPRNDMNPVLLKPQSDKGSQVIVQGRIWGNLQAKDYWRAKGELLPRVLDSFGRLAADADLVLVEGAGSPAEVNLRAGDIANMGFAEAANLPVLLLGDISRGGVIANLVGTATLLPEDEGNLIKGFIINKFRGDISLFDEGLRLIEEKSGFAALGIVPFFAAAARLPAEDAMALERPGPARRGTAGVKIAVPRLSRIANFDDFDPLLAEPDVTLDFVEAGRALPGDADLVILPGSKATIGDLADFRAQGWDIDLAAHVRRGGWVLGICGGLQMLGQRLSDPEGIEGPPGEARGLGYLEIETRLGGGKTLVESEGQALGSGQAVRGYEMHVGRTGGPGMARPMLTLAGQDHGAVSPDGRVMGCYLHGLFAADGFRHSFLEGIRRRASSGLAYESQVEATLDSLAAHLERHLDLDRILAIARTR
jgi:adenosylcobyric acid synthase